MTPDLLVTTTIEASQQLPAGSSTVEIVLLPAGEATVVELTHRDLPVDRQVDHREGWTNLLGVLASILQE